MCRGGSEREKNLRGVGGKCGQGGGEVDGFGTS